MKNPELVLAILGAGALIGAGLFLGLRSQVPAVVPTAASASASSRPAVPDARRELRAAIEQRRPELVRVCWTPLAARSPEPRSSEHVWNGTIGPEGIPLAFSVMEVRGKSRPELSSCLQDQLATLRLSPRPDSAFVELAFTLP